MKVSNYYRTSVASHRQTLAVLGFKPGRHEARPYRIKAFEQTTAELQSEIIVVEEQLNFHFVMTNKSAFESHFFFFFKDHHRIISCSLRLL